MNERNQLLFCTDERDSVANQNSEVRKRFLTRTYLALCAAVAAFVALCLGLTGFCGDVAVSFSREHPWSWLGVAFALIIATYVARYQALIRLGGGRRGQFAMLAINVVGSALFYLPYFAYASQNKDSFPGCYDISSAGHIPAGIEWKESALRELEEELGIDWICEEDLLLCGQRKITHDDEFHGKPFVDRQLSNIYCLWLDVEPSKLRLQEEEVESVVWMNLADCKHRIATEDPSFQHAIVLEELEMLPRE